jgi:hypothetical protein
MYVDNSQFQNRWVICDLDDTLFTLSEERVEMVKAQNYDKFNATVHQGEVIPLVRDLLSILYQNGAKIAMMTCRVSTIEEQTRKQLHEHRVPYSRLIMRPEGWMQKSEELKPMLIKQFFRLDQVALVLEDRDTVVEALRAIGLNVWQVRKGQY